MWVATLKFRNLSGQRLSRPSLAPDGRDSEALWPVLSSLDVEPHTYGLTPWPETYSA